MRLVHLDPLRVPHRAELQDLLHRQRPQLLEGLHGALCIWGGAYSRCSLSSKSSTSAISGGARLELFLLLEVDFEEGF